MSDNLRGAILISLAMAGFALEDMFIKLLADTVPVGQILVLLGLGGAVAFGLIAHRKGQPVLSPALLSRTILIRNLAEMIGTVGFVLGFVLASLATASAILQATPLMVTLGAVVFFGEKVGWRRWSAIFAGFLGVLLIVRPGMAGFEPASILAVIGVLGLAGRDLATRAVPRAISSYQLSTWAFFMMIPAGVFLMLAMGEAPVGLDLAQIVKLGSALGIGVFAYYGIVAAMRIGELSFVTPFRYTRMLFALIIAVLVFGERPDGLTLTGAGIIICAGLFTLWRERKVA
ncbi:DMT family transporter [Natronohydrobacter thiooxidans]|uniref:DMT family transporter n=1 Tax=Natronohydrobacter thiooxidans TaxID=87172 RepID=UPI0008FF3497|nr:DMT family transporter [Natronohydrobacter thiooxidans]